MCVPPRRIFEIRRSCLARLPRPWARLESPSIHIHMARHVSFAGVLAEPSGAVPVGVFSPSPRTRSPWTTPLWRDKSSKGFSDVYSRVAGALAEGPSRGV